MFGFFIEKNGQRVSSFTRSSTGGSPGNEGEVAWIVSHLLMSSGSLYQALSASTSMSCLAGVCEFAIICSAARRSVRFVASWNWSLIMIAARGDPAAWA